MEGVGKHIAELRAQRGLSVREVAMQIGMLPDYWRQIEDGRWTNPRDILPRIAKVLGTTIPDLLDYPEVHPADPDWVERFHLKPLYRILFFKSREEAGAFRRLLAKYRISHRPLSSHDVLLLNEDLDRVASWKLFTECQPMIQDAFRYD